MTARAELDDSWKGWIAENLALGAKPARLVDVLIGEGIPRRLAEGEVTAAHESPYLQGFTRLAARLKKRDWLLGVLSGHWHLLPESREVVRVDKPSGDEFLTRFYAAHRPCVITGAMEDWPARDRWTLDYLEERVGDAEVEIQFDRDRDEDYERNSDAHKRRMPFWEFVGLLRQGGTTNNFYCTANNAPANREALEPLWDDVGALDPYLDPATRAAGGFIWIGPRGTITPFHHDLTNNLLAMIRGRKRVRLVSSYETPLMRNHVHSFSKWDGADLPGGPPGPGRPLVIDCLLQPGEALFIPVGWWHLIEGVDLTFSVSFTNFRWRNDWYETYSTYGAV